MKRDVTVQLDEEVIAKVKVLAFWDAMIVEAALLSGATALLSDLLQDGRRIGPLTIENPFAQK